MSCLVLLRCHFAAFQRTLLTYAIRLDVAETMKSAFNFGEKSKGQKMWTKLKSGAKDEVERVRDSSDDESDLDLEDVQELKVSRLFQTRRFSGSQPLLMVCTSCYGKLHDLPKPHWRDLNGLDNTNRVHAIGKAVSLRG